MTGTTIESARGRWREILPQLGIESRFLTNKHGPCPLCGGKDRYRFDDKGGEGSYYCAQCGPGNGLILVRKKRGWDFKTAVDEIDKIIGAEGPAVSRRSPRRGAIPPNVLASAAWRVLSPAAREVLMAMARQHAGGTPNGDLSFTIRHGAALGLTAAELDHALDELLRVGLIADGGR
jgi:hypothetical protein